jgi:sugar phosphate isomerase/epimerase
MPTSSNLQIGFNARLFPTNWRPVVNEIRFGTEGGFAALQLPGKETGLTAEHLGDEIKTVRRALDDSAMVAVMEMMIHVDAQGYSPNGHSPVDILVANLPAIVGLRCRCVHFHFVPQAGVTQAQMPTLEGQLAASLDMAVGLGKEWGFRLGLEHNEASVGLFATPQACAHVLTLVPHLHFVWDVNHTHPDHVTSFAELLPRVSMVHVADTRLPTTNEHLPLGLGHVDFAHFCQRLRAGAFAGPAILEIGGLPKSGGFGRDSDSALLDSLHRLQAANALLKN